MSTSDRTSTSFNMKKMDEDLFHILVQHPNHFVALSDVMPLLNNFGLYVLTESAEAHNGMYCHTYTCQGPIPGENFIPTLQQVWNGHLTDDDFNRVVTTTHLTGQQVNVLRAYGRYLQQLSFAYSTKTLAHTLAKETNLTHMLWHCLERHLNANDVSQHWETLKLTLHDVHADVESMYQAYIHLFTHTLRLHVNDVIAFKLYAHAIECIPYPRPLYETFVYSPRVEGIHLRNGAVARGGIRWSERDDYRTEINELLRAQTLKNSIIVPTGGKGGFICQKWNQLLASGADDSTLMAEKTVCYETFISALLKVIDLHPSDPPVYPHDQVDAYFTVAADKGTAEFSNLANQHAQKCGFWLGDAFASGGSNGYNHKDLGITSRGAWVSLDHHCKNLELKQPLSFAGVGDMSGDVFGNGLLHPVRLIAAFNHQHIFIDPSPDIETSLEERKRLFHLPKSTWSNYNPQLLSTGGCVLERWHSHATLSPEAAAALNVDVGDYLTNDVIRFILQAPVDVLWFGGIGTYIKSKEESHQNVQDRANDAVRINGEDVRAKMIVEGANLGITQAGRVEYALKGGVINIDGVDNSAGVDCSDHEVNIKIFLRHKGLPEKDIHTWLEEIKDEVANLVLCNSQAQNNLLTIMESESQTYEPLRQYFKQKKVRDGLPRGLQLHQRPLHRWTRPELCYLMAYAKNDLKERLIKALDGKNLSLFNRDIMAYFPTKMQQYFGSDLSDHPLRLALIATLLANHLINTWGPMWALPNIQLESWIVHYQWIRGKRKPQREEASLWQVLITYLHRSNSHHASQAYDLMWGDNPCPTWFILWGGLQHCGDIPAVWDLGSLLLEHLIQNSSQICPNNAPSHPNLSEWTHFILNLSQPYSENG